MRGRAPSAMRMMARTLSSSGGIYHIDEVGVHSSLDAVVTKHSSFCDRWAEKHTVCRHTVEAFQRAQDFVSRFHHESGDDAVAPLPLILDSGCGTGRSSVIIARDNPDVPVLGLDRSLVRLTRNAFYDGRADEGDQPPNLLLLRCDLVDFWFLAHGLVASRQWAIARHYILYANPYPKNSQLKQRWHGHPVFPYLLMLEADEIVLRSSWRTYLEEFDSATRLLGLGCNGGGDTTADDARTAAAISRAAASYANGSGPCELRCSDKDVVLTNFEEKYRVAGQPTYELCLRKEGGSSM